MLLQQIKLKGFLSYYGKQNETGNIEPVVIDFSDSQLWLIHGKNGTGKTSLFDAITFALYEQHRGSGSRNSRADYLIHHQSERAEIELEIELEGQRYLIQRTIERIRRKTQGKYKKGATLWGIVRRWTDNSWQAIPSSEKAVAEWVEKHIKINYETFVSSVLLRQGDADAFLKTKPTERKQRLLKLLDLDFYKELGEKATQKRNEINKEKNKIQLEIDQLSVVTEEDLKFQEQVITDTEQLLAQTKQLQSQKLQEGDNAQNAADYLNKIALKESQKKSDEEIFAKAKTILEKVRRYQELKIVLQHLDNLWRSYKRLAEEESRIQETNEKIETLKDELKQISPQLENAKEAEKNQEKKVVLATQRLEQLKQRQQDLTYQLKDLEQIERLERQIQNAEEQLKPYFDILERSPEIEQSYKRYEQLCEAVPLLQNFNKAQQELIEAEAKFKTTQDTINTYQEKVTVAKIEEERIGKIIASLQKESEQLQQDLQNCRAKLSILQEKLEHRESVSHAKECPVCGSHLDDEEIQERLTQECQSWREEILKLKEKQESINERLKLKQKEKSEADVAFKRAVEETRNSERELLVAQTQERHNKNFLSQQQQAVNLARKEAGIWMNYLEQLICFEAELQNLKTVPREIQKLSEAKAIESTVKNNIVCYCNELEKLSKSSAQERENIHSDAEKIAQIINECREIKQTNESELNQAKSQCQQLENQKKVKESELNLFQHQLSELKSRQQQANQEVEQQQNLLPLGWREHPACENQEALEKLHQELNSLNNSETEEDRLREAQERYNHLTGEIKTLQELLIKIPSEHRRPIAEVQREIDEIHVIVKQNEEKINFEKHKLIELKNQKKQSDEQRKKLKEIGQELNYYQHLADTLGTKELQAQIIQEAQEKIKVNANQTLQRLSNGRWQIDLEENDDKTELNIVARDLNQSGTPTQQFEYLSSGEKFIVAVSLAVAIGQSIYGGRTVDTLIIDEGFGTLDDEKRPLMVHEIRRLSDDVLRGGRVIIVSHQEDVCEEFDSRYCIYRDDNNYAQVQLTAS